MELLKKRKEENEKLQQSIDEIRKETTRSKIFLPDDGRSISYKFDFVESALKQ